MIFGLKRDTRRDWEDHMIQFFFFFMYFPSCTDLDFSTCSIQIDHFN